MIKNIRIVCQLMFLIVSLLVIFGLVRNQDNIAVYYALHVFPSLAPVGRFVFPSFFAITFSIMILPFFAGRLYCGFLCPVGFIQDLVGYVARFFKIKQKRSYTKINVSFLVFLMSTLLIFSGSSFFGWFDHFSNFTRLVTVFDNPYSTQFYISLVFLFVITVVALFRPRWFCATLCPSGGLFSFLNKRSRLRIVENEDCKICKNCKVDCPTLCIEDGVVNHEYCVSCFECTDNCNFDGFKLKWNIPFTKGQRKQSRSKREFIKGAAIGSLGLLAGYGLKSSVYAKALTTSSTILPPGAKSVERFMSLCSFCNLCVEACPTKVLVPTYLENGFIGLPKPKMDYPASYCSYECIECLSICPTGAIDYFPLESKKTIKIGSVELNEETCIPFVNGEDCAACAEHCPTGGVVTENREGIRYPVINQDYCIGCGACQNICPVEPIRAIVIKPDPIHTIAYSPVEKAPPRDGIEEQQDSEDLDFPF